MKGISLFCRNHDNNKSDLKTSIIFNEKYTSFVSSFQINTLSLQTKNTGSHEGKFYR